MRQRQDRPFRAGDSREFARTADGEDDTLAYAADEKAVGLGIVSDVFGEDIARGQPEGGNGVADGRLALRDAVEDFLEFGSAAQRDEIVIGADIVDQAHGGPVAEGGGGGGARGGGGGGGAAQVGR